jgi:hypothetical protein
MLGRVDEIGTGPSVGQRLRCLLYLRPDIWHTWPEAGLLAVRSPGGARLRTLFELRRLGYQASLEGESIRPTYRGEGFPNPEKVSPLLEALRREKVEAIRLPQEAKPAEARKIKTDEEGHCRIYSDLLGDYLWVVSSLEETADLIAQGEEEPIHTAEEFQWLSGISRESIRLAHAVKRTFRGSKIQQVCGIDKGRK